MTSELVVTHEAADGRGRFIADLGEGHEAELTYGIREADGAWIVDHTGVPRAFEGKGIALRLVTHVVEKAREADKSIVPVCPYVVMQFRRHPDWADVLTS
ncbi:GNAT family N-acetyltransferase [Pelagibacterium montanilacus]|uniref:GNAT family N-acetyltransferase n=1 Tax=Pelagibacterium montanilacus TaxID=2185280 RepID=UPI000F8C53D4|nr:GNAT family N-acetyltransferase [Pelagibacterium montanilacus]